MKYDMQMKKFLLAGIIAAGLAPMSVLAASPSDVSIPGNTTFSVGGISMTVSNGTIVSTAVDSSSFTITLAPGSTVKVVATGLNQMALTGSTGFVTDTHCNSSASDATFAADSNAATTTITVTPSSTLCGATTSSTNSDTTTSNSGGGGGGGGGGGVSYGLTGVTTNTTSTVPPATGTVAALQAQLNALLAQIAAMTGKANPSLSGYVNANANASFKRNLSVGATGTDVKSLQMYLNAHGFPVAASGAGSPGNETTKFGKATKAALAKWQASVGISPATGNFGPLTRAYLAAHW